MVSHVTFIHLYLLKPMYKVIFNIAETAVVVMFLEVFIYDLTEEIYEQIM